ncbi:MAG: rhamnulokinase [Planctomycetota bacterium]|nr:MAG: rhamnulokinase [Planctomycetota bacterium]
MPEKVFLAIDLGAESGRVIAGRFDGTCIQLDELHRFPNGPVDVAGTRRWDVLRLWSEIQTGLTNAATKYGEAVTSVGVDTWGVDYVLLSGKDEILGQPYNYRDARTQGMLAQAFTRVPQSEIFARTGLQFMEINTLYQLLSMHLSDPDLLNAADRFLMMPDFFHWLLCGSKVVEFTNATTSQCFDATQRDWATDMLRKLGIPTHIFPEVVSPGTRLGTLRETVAAATGLRRIDIVAPATHDTGSAVAAVPTERTGRADWAYISSGTWSLIGVEVQDAVLSEAALALNVTNEGGIDGTYRLLKNVMGLWLVQECRKSFQRQGTELGYEQLAQLAEQAEPFRSLVDPNDDSLLSPSDMPQAIQECCRRAGQPVPETEGQLVRCALESLALKYREVLEGIESLTGERIEVIHVVGGGGRNALLNQFTASACGKPVAAGPTEATALGNVLVQARAAGEIGSLSEIRSVVRDSSEITTFEPRDTNHWDDAYVRFQDIAH